jgi:hypothetical protein
MSANSRKVIFLVSLIGCGMAAAQPHVGEEDSQAQQTQSARVRGAADATAAFARGHPGLYVLFYSNMPNGPDDPILAQERDLLLAVLKEKGIEPFNSNPGCIISSTLPEYSEGYNSIADGLLKAMFGPSYMDDIHKEVSRRMKASASTD